VRLEIPIWLWLVDFHFLSGAAICIQRAAAPVVFRTARRVEFQTMLFIVVLFSVQHSLGEIAPPVGF
jgi:TRAP-type C4-dicarboxylate transport system permease large subunit